MSIASTSSRSTRSFAAAAILAAGSEDLGGHEDVGAPAGGRRPADQLLAVRRVQEIVPGLGRLGEARLLEVLGVVEQGEQGQGEEICR